MTVAFSDLRRIVVAIDPAVTSGEEADETGIVVVGRGPHQEDTCRIVSANGRCPGHGYVLADLTFKGKPHEWARRAVRAYDVFKADRIVAEVNNGGDLVEATVRSVRAGIPFSPVHASRGKAKRAEPVAALWEQGRCHFAVPLPELEDELTSWDPEPEHPGRQRSPNRMDALVWGCTALNLVGGQGAAFLSFWRGEIATQRKEDDKGRLPGLTKAESKALGNLIKRGPKFGVGPVRRAGRCEHRWRGSSCVFCGEDRGAAVVPIR